MDSEELRWHQRLQNFERALKELEEAVDLASERDLSKLEKLGLIHAFENTHELSWKTLKDFFYDQGNNFIYGSKDATREAFKLGLIKDGHTWMDMIKSRNLSSHTYNLDTANLIANKIIKDYFELFENLILELNNAKNVKS